MIPSKFYVNIKDHPISYDKSNRIEFIDHGHQLFCAFRLDSTWAVICVIIGSTVTVSTSPRKSPRKSLNISAPSASMHATHRNCTAYAGNRTTRHSSTYAAISVRTGSMVVALAFYKPKPKASTNMCAPTVRRTVR